MKQEERFVVYYTESGIWGMILPLDFIFLFVAVIFCVLSKTARGACVIAIVVSVVLGALSVFMMAKTKRKEHVLLEMDSNGIRDHNPVDAKGYISWKYVDDVTMWYGAKGNRALLFIMKDRGILNMPQKVYINISFAQANPQEILQRARAYLEKSHGHSDFQPY